MPKRPFGPGKENQRCIHVSLWNLRLVLWYANRYTPIRLRRSEVYRRGVWEPWADRPEVLSMPRALSGGPGEGPVYQRPKPKLFERFPELVSWLTDSAYPDGKPVGMVQLSIRPKGAVFVVQLRIQDQGGMLCSVEDPVLDDALLLLEASLTASPVPWTRDPYPLGVSQTKKRG